MRTNCLSRVTLSLASLLVSATSVLSQAPTPRRVIRFGLDIPDPTVLEESHVYRKEMMTGLAKPEVETFEVSTRYTIRRTSTGYTVITEPIQKQAARSTAPDARSAIFGSFTLSYDLDVLGKLLRVRGADEAFKRLQDLDLNGLLALAGQKQQTPHQMVAEAWNQMVVLGFQAGYEVDADTPYVQRRRLPSSPGQVGNVTLERTTYVSGSPQCSADEPRCTEVLITETSTDPSIGAQVAQLMRQALVRVAEATGERNIEAKLPKLEMRNAKLVDKHLRSLDATTGIPYWITTTRTVDATMVIAGEASPFKTVHKNTWIYRRIR